MINQILTKLYCATTTDHQMIASHYKRPHGFFASVVGNKMTKQNQMLYDLTIDCMDVKSGNKILEIGFGNGAFLQKLFTTAPSLQVSGVEISPPMLHAATIRNKRRIKQGMLKLFPGCSCALPMEDNSFDKVVCIDVNYFWEYPGEHLAEIYRVLKPGGRFYTSMRPEQTLRKIPFTQYEFILYTEHEWQQRVEEYNFTFHESRVINDNLFSVNKIEGVSKALCMIFQKL